jgi:hypothetical protein
MVANLAKLLMRRPVHVQTRIHHYTCHVVTQTQVENVRIKRPDATRDRREQDMGRLEPEAVELELRRACTVSWASALVRHEMRQTATVTVTYLMVEPANTNPQSNRWYWGDQAAE